MQDRLFSFRFVALLLLLLCASCVRIKIIIIISSFPKACKMRTSLHYETAAGGADREMRWQFLLWKLHKIAASSVQSPPKKKMSKSNNNKYSTAWSRLKFGELGSAVMQVRILWSFYLMVGVAFESIHIIGKAAISINHLHACTHMQSGKFKFAT